MLRATGHQEAEPARIGAPPRPLPAIVAGRLAAFWSVRLTSAGQRPLLAAGGLLLLLLLLLPAIVAGALRWDGIYPGVRAGGTRLGGADRTAATARIDAAAARWEALPVTLTMPDGAATFSRAALGLRYDREATLAAAFAAGRGGGPLGRLGALVGLAWSGRDVAGPLLVDDAALRAQLGALAGTANLPAHDGDLRIDAGQVVVVPASAGRGLDVEATAARLLAAVAADGPVTVPVVVADDLQPRVGDAALAAARARAEALLAAPLVVAGDGVEQRYDVAALGAWLAVRRDPAADPPLAVAVERDRVRAALAPLAGPLARAPRDAGYAFDPRAGAFVVTAPDEAGRALDLERTVDAVLAALEAPGPRVVAPVTVAQPAALTGADIERISAETRRTYLAGPLTFRQEGRAWTVPVETLATWLTVEASPRELRLVFDLDRLGAYLAGLAPQVERPAVDAGYAPDAGGDAFHVTSPSRPGLALDQPAALRAALAALAGGDPGARAVVLPTVATRPAVTEDDVAAMVAERWIDVDLTRQRMYAMVGDTVVYTALISSGKAGWQTPTGTFRILRRVENETMTSGSIGAEEFYELHDVLYTQYFTEGGHALHLSWWKDPGSFGTPTSHGCISETLEDAEYFWRFARVGTRLVIHGDAPID